MARNKQTNAGAVLDAVINRWGGVGHFVDRLAEEIEALPAGHSNRLKFYVVMLQALLNAPAVDDGAQTLEEKREELKSLLAQMESADD